MTWNHRVIRTENSGEFFYAIHECFYDSKDDLIPLNWTADSVSVACESREGLPVILAQMAEAVGRPVLAESDGKLIEVEPAHAATPKS